MHGGKRGTFLLLPGLPTDRNSAFLMCAFPVYLTSCLSQMKQMGVFVTINDSVCSTGLLFEYPVCQKL